MAASVPGALGGFAVSHQPAAAEGWLELLGNGLTFDLAGLAPGLPGLRPAHRHAFGLDGPELPPDLEAVSLVPSPHVIAGGALLPVVRAMAAIAADLAVLDGVRAVCWHPAGSCIETRLFVRTIRAWLEGGAFPALGLTALVPDAGGGGLRSEGLAFFIGQELWLEPAPGEAPGDVAKLAVRLIHGLVEDGAIHSVTQLVAPDGAMLDAEPSFDGRVIRIWRRR